MILFVFQNWGYNIYDIICVSVFSGSVVGVDLTTAKDGDRATLVSPAISVRDKACLSLDHDVTSSAQLDVFIHHQYEPISIISKQLLCSVENYDNIWNTTYIMLPPGNYSLIFEAIIGDRYISRVRLDNITLLNENCTKDIPITTTPRMYYVSLLM